MATLKMIAPVGFLGTVQGIGGNYTPDAFGFATVQPADVSALLLAGWSVPESVAPNVLGLTAENALTALAGGAQAGTPLNVEAAIHRITTVATAADSAQLPAAVKGALHIVKNTTANACAVFPQTGEAINALSANAAFSVAAAKSCLFFCAVAGTWDTLLTA